MNQPKLFRAAFLAQLLFSLTVFAQMPPEPPGGWGTNSDPIDFGDGGVPMYDYGTNIWLLITNAANNQASGSINNSSIYTPYTVFSKQSLLWPIWNAEATFYGSWITNSTAFSISMLSRSNLFLEARSEIAPHIVGAGNTTFAALRRDDTVWTWGNGNYGQLGNGQWENSSTPVQVAGLSNVVAIATPSDGDYTLALDAYGNVWSWGTNYSGQLGRNDGLYEAEDTPAVVPGLSNIVAIAGGVAHAMALKSDGTVWAWGDNAYGDLGDESGTQRDYAAPVPGLTNAIAIASGDYHCFAICADGTVWGWGLNELDELGIGNEDDQPTPVLVPGLTNAVALAGGLFHSIALLSNGTIEAWGDDIDGEIGDINSSTPVSAPGWSNIVSIACGQLHNLFIDTNGNLYAWGYDGDGQFGDGGADYGSTAPYLLTTVSNVTAIAGGKNSSIISLGNGDIYTFGDSFEYQSTPTLTDLYTNYSSDGSGLPDWWETRYFSRLGLNPDSDPVGDGLTLIQDFEQNLDPTNFLQPPAVTGLAVAQTNALGNIMLTWSAETPTPLDYAIYRIDFNYDTWQYSSTQEIGEVAGNVTTFTDNGNVPGGDDNSIYEVDGIYGGGDAPFSAESYVNSQTPGTMSDNLPFTAQLVRNGTGRWQIMFSGISPGLQTIRLYWYDSSYLDLYDLQAGGIPYTTQDIAMSNLVSGVYAIPDSDIVNDLGTTLYAQSIGPDGLPGQENFVGALPEDAPYFVNGRQHMEQNLKFLIRGASINQPFSANLNGSFYQWDTGPYTQSTNLEEFSFLHQSFSTGWNGDNNGPFLILDNLWPFEANYSLSDYLLQFSSQTDFGANTFNFQPDFGNDVPAPPILDQSDPYWIFYQGFSSPNVAYDTPGNTADWGVTLTYTNTVASLQSGIYNLFGLPFEGGEVVSHGTNWVYQSLPLGDTIDVADVFEEYASWCPAPTLSFVNYYFGPLINSYGDPMDLPGETDPFDVNSYHVQPNSLPIFDDFAVTNQTPAVMFGSVGQPMILGAWAKYSIQGSSPAKYAYLGQYFTTNAYEVNSDGNITTTNAGIVSPYGEFFPTNPGPAALITMVNPDTGTQATGIVDVISLALDANHDGTIDPTWNGPDMTSSSAPYVFWCNNNFDRWAYDEDDATDYMDDVQSGDTTDPAQNLDPNDPDCNYVVDGNRVIPDTRDLEDFARLWVCGVTSNLLAALPAGCTVTLNWGDVGNPNPNNPTIDLFAAADTNGGMGYLTNETTAIAQIDDSQCPYIGRVGPGSNFQLNASTFLNNWAGNYFIWCGVSNGTGGLNLTVIGPNSNVLAQTTAYIQIKDIKQMYERWTVGDNPTNAPENSAQLATNDLPAGATEPFRYVNPSAPNTPYVLYVHGWNMETWEKDRFAETAFKRLYWQGYQGRFGVFRWPTGNGFSGWKSLATDPDNYDNSEFNAWYSGYGLLNKLNDLNQQYPGNVYLMAHSMGNVVAGEALRLASSSQPVNTYIAMQGAVPSQCYDPTTLARTNDDNFLGLGYGSIAPNCYVNYWTNGAPCYFHTSAGAGAYVNFFNTNDFALTYWQVDQDFKPCIGFSYNSTANAFYADGAELYFPQDTYEIFAYCDTAFCYALGQQANVGGTFEGAQEDLQSVWLPDPTGGNYIEHFWHSAEFRGDYPTEVNFWTITLGAQGFNLK